MITTATQTSLRDAMYAMSLAKAVPDAELLDEFARRYPQHADALTEFAIELAIDSLMHRSDEEDVPADADAISDLVSRVMSQFENQLYERRQARAATPPARAATAFAENPFATLDRQGFRALASRLDINSAFLSKLRDRTIEPISIPKTYCRYLAEEMDEETEAMAAHLYAPQESAAAGRQLYKAEGKPTATARQSFEEAVKTSGLSEEQQRRLLSFRD
ncbi:hypothetical protein [Bradyrhizobium sp. SSUT77]|uniref:hypothetical protein n=1 Tax=Bradyrhizobium sp. SSUT77 TaxID=3040603 RepID=UPI002449B0C5|nr:hypothetical protein [Bradyrhizobium sp. SSUT77]MDH2346794.1 hypothetical protein [Bradyrhizobium sp. SSUT77]